MFFSNKSYENQIISIDVTIFSIIDNKLSVLLLKRNDDPYKNVWSLAEGTIYNDETCENAVRRELKEKLNIKKIEPVLAQVFSDPNRDKRYRNISISYYCLVDGNKFESEKNNEKTAQTKWFYADNVPVLAFDHNIIYDNSLKQLQSKAYDIDFIKNYIPSPFTLRQLQEIYESILHTKLDKRNFRRKINSLNCLADTGRKNETDSRKKSFLYAFK